MEKINRDSDLNESIAVGTAALFREHQQSIFQRTDRLFAWLMIFQWLAGIAAACWISPKTWAGQYSQIHLHVWAAVFLGGVISLFPVVLALTRPGASSTRHVIAVGQMLMSALLIHLTGGRIETHFHVFGSLAFLAFYRDWRVFVPATLVVAADHFLRGVYWPQSVFGVLTASPWRWVEHAGWVIFEDIFLVTSCLQSVRETRDIARQRAQLEASNELVECEVRHRTAELQASEQRKGAIMASALDCIITIDAQGRVTEFNPAAENTFGYTRGEILGKEMAEMIIPPAMREAHRSGLSRYLATGEGPVLGKRIEIPAMRADGSEFPVELAITSINHGGSPIFTAFLRDLSERKRAEEDLKAAKEAAEAASRAKSDFLANMSHEIRTPMNGIMGMTDLVLDTQLSREQREYLNLVKASADSLLTVINDILDFSKIDAGKLDFDAIEFSLRDSLGDTMKALSLRADEKGLELACHVRPDVPDALVGDPGRLRQIVVNLVGNAIKFTERGEVLVEVQAESQTEDSIQLHLAVTDTGMGIPAEKQRAIFDAFTQADGSMTRKFGGTGLGLTISSRLVEGMGGRIWVESEPGRGSTFHLTARLGLQKAPALRPRPAEPVNLYDLPVLVVDDNATNRRILVEMLKNWRMRPTPVEGGPMALDVLEQACKAGKQFPLILLDAQMPGMDGFALVEQMKQIPELAGATIMMLTSAGCRGDAARCRELGIAAYLTKPIKQSDLLDAISLALGTLPREAGRIPLVTRHALRESRQRLRILLAEDNAVNQALAVRLLEKRGHAVTVAGDGRAAFAALEETGSGGFDVVLMDVQLPELDGFEATAAIRGKEKATGGHIPIIAMTAHAMKGDRERCLDAGMDGYVSKPIQAKELFETLEGFGVRARAGEPAEKGGHAALDEPIR